MGRLNLALPADVVSGVQGSLQSLFGMSSYLAALAFSDLAAFPWLMLASCIVVLTGVHVCRRSAAVLVRRALTDAQL